MNETATDRLKERIAEKIMVQPCLQEKPSVLSDRGAESSLIVRQAYSIGFDADGCGFFVS